MGADDALPDEICSVDDRDHPDKNKITKPNIQNANPHFVGDFCGKYQRGQINHFVL
jgi:hypothetical protein